MSNWPWVPVLVLALSMSAGCGDSKPAGAPTTAAPVAKPDDGLPNKFSPFTAETVRSLAGLVEVGEPYDPARKKLDARLGLSIYHDSGAQMWSVAEGEQCWSTALTPDGDKVKTVVPPAKLTAADGDAYKHCVAASGRNKCFRDGASPRECTKQFPTVGL